MRINREQFNKWLRALKSGRYEQTSGTLQDEHGYCCLGVACKVLIPKGKLEMKEEENEEGEMVKTKFIKGDLPRDQKYAPAWLEEIASLKIEPSNEGDGKTTGEITDLNDNQNWDFKMIAEALEGSFPDNQKYAPKWTREINDDFENIKGNSLSELNDEQNYTFKQIADELEKTYPERKASVKKVVKKKK